MHLRIRLGIFLSIGLICVAVGWAFQAYIFDGLTLIGDSDRLNAFLNIRKFELDGIALWGRVPSWNERIFMGNGIAGLHYMLPTVGFSSIEALFQIEHLFRAMTFVTALLVACAGVAAFLFIRDVCKSDLPAAVGAVAYCLSVYAVHRSAQLDSSLAVLVHIPIGMLLIRKTDRAHLTVPFLGLAIVAASLVFFTFLQEAAYAFVLMGLYAVHRSVFTKSITPLALFLGASFIAIGSASPRVLTVLEDFRELDRTKDFQQTSWIEIYRFFSEGFFGRTQGEGRGIGNGTNLHEGLQLLGSSMAALLAVLGAFYGRTKYEKVAGFFLLVSVSMILGGPLYGRYGWLHAKIGTESIELSMLIANFIVGLALVLLLRSRDIFGRAEGHGRPPGLLAEVDDGFEETAFCYAILTLVLCVVLVTEFRYRFYQMFFKVDFTHARFSIAALLPFCTLIALVLQRIAAPQAGEVAKPSWKWLVVTIIGSVALVCAIEGVALARVVESLQIRPPNVAWNHAMPLELFRLTAWVVALAFAVLLIRRSAGSGSSIRVYVAVALGTVIVGESASYAQFKLTGPHTEDQGIPFLNNSYMNAVGGDLQPPSRDEQAKLQQKLQAEDYRSVFVAPPEGFPAFVAPHLANFWGLRVVDGYSAGVPRRLARFDWPGDVRTLRSISFGSTALIPWELLAYLNVKYAVSVDKELYYNRSRECSPARPDCNSTLHIQENPFEPLPRYFFAANALSGDVPFASAADQTNPVAPKSIIATASEDKSITLSWNAPWWPNINFKVERRDANFRWPEKVIVSYFPGAVDRTARVPLDGVARYIRIQLDHADALGLSEVRVYGVSKAGDITTGAISGRSSASEIVELAFGKVAKQSSVAGGASAALAVDGKVTGKREEKSIALTNRENSAWWEVDLGGAHHVSHVELWGQTDCCAKRLKSLYVLGSLDPFSENFSVPLYSLVGDVGPSGRSHLSANLPPGRRFMFRTQSCIKDVCSEYSDVVDLISASGKVEAPKNLTVSKVSENSIRLAWKGGNLLAGYLVERRRGAESGFVQIGKTSPGQTELLFPYSLENPADTYRVRACVESECSSHSEAISISELSAAETKGSERVAPRVDLKGTSFVEGLKKVRRDMPTSGKIDARFSGDWIEVKFDSSPEERLLVLNEMYHPNWKAFTDGRELTVHPTNTVMRGVFIPPNTSSVTFRFVPFISSGVALFIMLLGLCVAIGVYWALARSQRRSRASMNTHHLDRG